MKSGALLSACLVLVPACGASPARTGEPDTAAGFAGQTITYIVSTGPGGGYDTYARLIARHMERHLEGARIVVRNMAGAAHQIGLSEIYRAAPDGLTIGTFTTGMVYLQLSGETGGRFDLARMSWVGKAASEPRMVAVGASSGFRSVGDLRRAARTVRFSTHGATSPDHIATAIVARALDVPVHFVHGFTEDEGQLAILRGDVDGVIASPSSLGPMMRQGHLRGLLRIGGRAEPWHDAPGLDDLALGDAERALLKLVATQADLGRLTAGPPGIPSERLDRLRQAYMSAVTDPALVSEAGRLGLPIDPIDGAAVAVRVSEALGVSPGVAARLRQLLSE